MRLLLLLALLLPVPAFAQQGPDMDAADLDHCLSEVGGQGPADAQACIGGISDACQKAEGAGSAADCALREADAWMTVAEARMEILRGKLKADILAETEAAQAAWTAYRGAHCAATGAFFYQYSGSASAQWQAQCLRDIAAGRAIELDDWAMRSEDF